MSEQRRHTRSLRRQLFGSHLLVMVIALVVLLAVAGIVSVLLELGGERKVFGRSEEGPTGAIFGFIAAVVASALVSLRMSRRFAAPLEEISAATRQLAAGRYNVRVPGADTLEFDYLASDVNQLAHELETTEQRRLRLIGDVAHELRNPLSTIEGTMEALLDGVMTADDDTFSRIARESARLRRLADDLSSLSHAGELGAIEGSPVDLAAIATDVAAQLEPQAIAKGLTLTVDTQLIPRVLGDADRLTQVLMNVVGNAVQYTETGSVSVRVASEGSHVVVDVSDTGRGLTTEDQRRIFERFHRVDEHFSEGTGVGLAIAKLIVSAHGGQITAASSGLGLGTTIRVALPVDSSSEV